MKPTCYHRMEQTTRCFSVVIEIILIQTPLLSFAVRTGVWNTLNQQAGANSRALKMRGAWRAREKFNIGALISRIWSWAHSTIIIITNPQNSIGKYLGLCIRLQVDNIEATN